MSKVHEAWDLAHSQISSPIPRTPTKPAPVLAENRQVLLPFWPKTHVCMATDWYSTIWTSILVHSHYRVINKILDPTCLADYQIVHAETSVYDCWCRFYHYKVKISSWVKFTKLVIWLTPRFLIQSRHMPPSQPPFWSKNEYFGGDYGQNDMCVRLYIIWMPL